MPQINVVMNKCQKEKPSPNLDTLQKRARSEKEPAQLSESMKEKWQSLNLAELTIRILKKDDTEETDTASLEASLHTTEDLDKESLLENKEMEEDCTFDSETETEQETETIVHQLELPLSPVNVKKIDMSVFTGKTDLEKENEKIDQDRLRKMMQLNETIKKKRQSLSIVEQLSNRLLQDKEKEMPTLEPAVPQRVHAKETQPSTSTSPRIVTFPRIVTSPRIVKKKPVSPNVQPSILMSAGFFDVFKKSNESWYELEFVCRVSPCSFKTNYRDTFVTHLSQDHVKINEEYKISECSACQGKIVPTSEKGFLRSFFLHMVDNHLDIQDTDQDVLNVKTIKRSMIQSNDDTVMKAGLLDIIKSPNGLNYVCRVVFCNFSAKQRHPFITHWNEEHSSFRMTQCRLCATEIAANATNNLLSNFFVHLDVEHLGIKSLPLPTKPVSIYEERLGIKSFKLPTKPVNLDGQPSGVKSLKLPTKPANLDGQHSGVKSLKLPTKPGKLDEGHLGTKSLRLPTKPDNFNKDRLGIKSPKLPTKPDNLNKDRLGIKSPKLPTKPVNLEKERLDIKSLKLPTKPDNLDEGHSGTTSLKLPTEPDNPFSFKISEVISIDDDPTPPPSPTKQQDFVIENVVSLAEAQPSKADEQKSVEPTPAEDEPAFVIGEVVSLADDLDSPGTSSKGQDSFVIESVNSLAAAPPPSPKQDTPTFVIENVISLADKPQVWKSESAIKAFLQNPHEIYKCPQFYCHFVSDNRHFFDMHVKSHGINEKLVRCVYCDVKTFMNTAGQHIDAHHQNCLYSCSQCLYRALRKEYVLVHMKLKHKTVSSIISLPKPLKMNKSPEKNCPLTETCHPYRCGYTGCNAEFLFQNDYTLHLDHFHGGTMICGFVDKQIQCKYRCLNTDSMIDHWRTHNLYSFHCLICQVGSMELYTMLEHYSFTHPNRTPSVVDRRRGPGDEIHRYNGKAFAKMKYISCEVFSSLGARHCNMVNADKKKPEVIQIEDVSDESDISDRKLLQEFGKLCEPVGKELKCPLCLHFKTKKVSYFIYHLFLELKCHRFKCNSCDYGCITYGAMAIHCQDEHKLSKMANVTQSPIDKPVQFWIELVINYQARVITSKYQREVGEESQSLGRNVQCDVCPKWFRNTEALHEHHLVHWAELVYICRQCRSRRPSFNEILQHTQFAHSATRDYCIARVPSVTKIVSNWKSFTSQPKKESVTVFQPVQGNSSDSQKILVFPSNAIGQENSVLYACLHCSKTVKSVEMLQKHNIEDHDGKTDDFRCKVMTKSESRVMLLAFVVP